MKPKNPLWFVALALLVTLPLDFYWYVQRHFLSAFGITVIVAKILFLVLYIRRSRFAWHVGLLVTAAITPLSLLLVRFGPDAEQHQYSRPVFEIAVVLILALYLCKIRERYRRYIEARI